MAIIIIIYNYNYKLLRNPTTAQTGLVYKNFLLLYNYVQVQSLVYELNLQASLQFFVRHFNGDLGLYT